MQGAVRQISAMFVAEVRLLRRHAAVLMTSVAVPVGISVYFVQAGRQNLGPLGWALPVAILFLMAFGMGVYMTTTLTMTARREDLYLKRLRTSEASDASIMIGLLSPVIAIGLFQCVLVVVIIAVWGPATPANPLLVVLALVLGLAMAVSMGTATTGVVGSTQQADMAAIPFFFLLILSCIWAATNGPEGPNAAQLFTPGGAVLDIARLAYREDQGFFAAIAEALPALGVLIGWTGLGAWGTKRLFRWEPRH